MVAALNSMPLAVWLFLTDPVLACPNYIEFCTHGTELVYHFHSLYNSWGIVEDGGQDGKGEGEVGGRREGGREGVIETEERARARARARETEIEWEIISFVEEWTVVRKPNWTWSQLKWVTAPQNDSLHLSKWEIISSSIPWKSVKIRDSHKRSWEWRRYLLCLCFCCWHWKHLV